MFSPKNVQQKNLLTDNAKRFWSAKCFAVGLKKDLHEKSITEWGLIGP